MTLAQVGSKGSVIMLCIVLDSLCNFIVHTCPVFLPAEVVFFPLVLHHTHRNHPQQGLPAMTEVAE